MWSYVWLFLVFVCGAAVGSFLNVAIARMPRGQSVFWPGSHCGCCRHPIAWFDNVPLLSYWWLRGKCRACGETYSIRYFIVELATALGFLGLFYVDVVVNVYQWPDFGEGWGIKYGYFPWQWWVGYAYHTALFCLLVVATYCYRDCRRISWRHVAVGLLLGLLGGALCLPTS